MNPTGGTLGSLVRLALLAVWTLMAPLASSWLAPSVVLAQGAANDEEARVHFRLGTAYYDSGRFARAAEEYQKAYDLSQRPALLYNLFLAWRDAGEIDKAAEALRLFLELDPNPPEREKLEARLASLEKMIEARGPLPDEPPAGEEPEPEAPAAEPEPVAEPMPPPADQGASEVGAVPWVVMGAGGALIVGGVVTGLLAAADEKAVEDACPGDVCSDPSDLERADSGKTKALVADVLLGAGIVTAAAGVVFLFWQPWAGGEGDDAVSFGCAPGGCAAQWSRRF